MNRLFKLAEKKEKLSRAKERLNKKLDKINIQIEEVHKEAMTFSGEDDNRDLFIACLVYDLHFEIEGDKIST
jgi:hypothetical protein